MAMIRTEVWCAIGGFSLRFQKWTGFLEPAEKLVGAAHPLSPFV